MSDDLPQGWAIALLKDAVQLLQNGPFGSLLHRSDYVEGGTPLINPANIVAGKLVPDLVITVGDELLYRLSSYVMRPGDVVVGRRGEMGRAALVTNDRPKWFCGTGCAFIRPGAAFDSTYLAMWFGSPMVRATLEAESVGATMSNLSTRILGALEVRVPPLAEQRRIVTRIEGLLARVHAARKRLEKVPNLLKRFRQAVLAKAFQGDLVPTEAELAAREDRPFQSATELFGQRGGPERADLPGGWVSTTVDQVLRPGGLFDGPFGSSLKTSDYTGAGVRVIRLENVANLRFVAEKETWISKAKYAELKRHSVGEGDIIFGSFVDDSCRVCILPALPTPAIAKADCFCLRPRDELVDRRFLVYQLGSAATRNALVEEIHGATRPRINTGQLRALNIVLPPIAEQRRIVAKVDALFAAAAIVEARTESLRTVLGRAPQTILQRAFTGELVATEADLAAAEQREFESGNDLLKRASSLLAAPVPRPRRTRTPAATG